MTTEKTTENLPKVSLSKAELSHVADAAATFLNCRSDQQKAQNALLAAGAGKLGSLVSIGVRACLDAVDRNGAYDRKRALALYDAMFEAFDARLIELDRKERQNESEPLPEPRELVKIDGSIRVYKSIIRKAIAAGHKVQPSDNKATLQEAAGNASTRSPRPASVPADAPSAEGQPRNVVQGADTLASIVPALREILTELGRVAMAATPTEQATLAECLIGALGEYKDRIAPPDAEPAPAPAPAPALTKAQARKLRPRQRKAA